MVRIFSDSTCDLSQELISRYGIGIIPLFIILGEKEYLDGRDLTPDDIYRWADAQRTTPKTAACSVELAAEMLRPCVEAGEEVICFSISESMSTSANAMRLAARTLKAEKQITVIDSANLSTGVGLLVVEAACMAQKGCTAEQIVAEIERLKPLVRASFVVDTLTYLHRGGRCSSVSALVGGTLKLHPRIVVENGSMHADKKYRGKMQRVLLNYVEDLKPALTTARKERVFITHSGCEQALLDEIRSELEKLGRFDEILTTRAGGVISSHCGPGTLGVLYIAGDPV